MPKVKQQDSLVERIDAQIAAAQRKQAEAEQAYADDSLALVERPDDADLHRSLADFKAARAKAADEIENLKAARGKAVERDTQAAKVAALAQQKAAVAQIEKDLAKLYEHSLESSQRAAEAASAKGAAERVAQEIRRAAWQVIRNATANEKIAERHAGTLRVVGQSLNHYFLGELHHALRTVRGVVVHPVRVPDARPQAEQLVRERGAVVSKLAQLVEQAEAEVNGGGK
jgi:hypothetical protein